MSRYPLSSFTSPDNSNSHTNRPIPQKACQAFIFLPIMATTADKIKEIESEMARTQKNKATSFHLGQLKAKLAKLKKELLTPQGSGGGGGIGFDVARTGVASVGFIG